MTVMADTFDLLISLAKSGAAISPEAIIEMSQLPPDVKAQVISKLQPSQVDQQALMMKMDQMLKQTEEIASRAALNFAKAQQVQIEAARGPDGAPQQVDTPADMAKADLDLAKASEIRHKMAVGAHVPQLAPAPPPEPGLFEVNAAKAREHDARAGLAFAQIGTQEAQRLKTMLEAQTISEAPPGMLSKPPPRPSVPPAGRRS